GFVIIVLPDGILSNPQYKYIRTFILQETEVRYIISLPRNIFEATSAKTSVLILQKERKAVLDYQSNLNHLEKSGNIDNTIKVRATNLINRMDYSYYHNLKKIGIKELMKKGIKFRLLKDFLIYCKTGKTLYGEERKFSKKGLRFLHATNITDIGINYKRDEKFIDPLSRMNFPGAYANVDDIVFVRVGVGCAGRVAIVNSKEDEGVATDYLHIFRVNGIDPHFLTIYLKTKYGKQSIELLKHGVGTVSINKSDISSIPIPVVSHNIQEGIKMRYKDILQQWSYSIDTTDDQENKVRNLIRDLEKILEDYGCEG
ncbi:MAG: N-6 DNA methylase, partial [bacterium]